VAYQGQEIGNLYKPCFYNNLRLKLTFLLLLLQLVCKKLDQIQEAKHTYSLPENIRPKKHGTNLLTRISNCKLVPFFNPVYITFAKRRNIQRE